MHWLMISPTEIKLIFLERFAEMCVCLAMLEPAVILKLMFLLLKVYGFHKSYENGS